MQVQIIESARGGKIAVHDGQSYNQKHAYVSIGVVEKNNKLKCTAILKTKNETVIGKRY